MKKYLGRNPLVNFILLVVAVLMIGFGILLGAVSGKGNAEAINTYNQALSVYDDEDYIYEEIEPGVYAKDPIFPVEIIMESAAYLQQAVSQSTDSKLKSLSLYNIATLIGRDYLIYQRERMPGFGIDEAVNKLKEALRLDPDNEDAKYNLELLESIETISQGNLSVKGSLGATDKKTDYDRGY